MVTMLTKLNSALFRCKHTNLPQRAFTELLELCLENAYCIFNKRFYKQTFGVPMGSPLWASVANLVMEDLEIGILETIPYKVKFFQTCERCSDCVHKNDNNYLLKKFNKFNTRLNFTIERENHMSISFSDYLVKRESGKLYTDWYRKPFWSRRYLHFNTFVPTKYKISDVNSLVDGAVWLFNHAYRNKNLDLVERTWLENDCPNKFFVKFMNERMENIENRNNSIINNIINIEDNRKNTNEFLVLPHTAIAVSIQKTFSKIGFQSRTAIWLG